MNIDIALGGAYTLSVVGADGQTKQRYDCVDELAPIDPTCNLITDYLLVSIAQSGNWPGSAQYALLSTSTAAPSFADTIMPGVVASRAATATSSTWAGSGVDWETIYTNVFSFAQDAYVGTFSSVALSGEADGSKLCSRLRLVDGEGNPTSMTLITGDQLTLTYILKAKRPNDTAVGNITLNGITYAYTMWPIGINGNRYMWQAWVGRWFCLHWNYGDSARSNTYSAANITVPENSVTDLPDPVGSLAWDKVLGITRYAGETYYDLFVNYTIAEGNGDITYVTWGSNSSPASTTMVCKFVPPIPKLNTQTLTLTWRVNIGRI